MTQREKLMKATMMAQRIKSVARSLELCAKDYDCLSKAMELNNLADEFLKLK